MPPVHEGPGGPRARIGSGHPKASTSASPQSSSLKKKMATEHGDEEHSSEEVKDGQSRPDDKRRRTYDYWSDKREAEAKPRRQSEGRGTSLVRFDERASFIGESVGLASVGFGSKVKKLLSGNPDGDRNDSEVTHELEKIMQRGREENAQVEGELPWIKTPQADAVFGIVIALNSLMMGIDIDVELREGGFTGPGAVAMLVIKSIFTVIFLFELGLRIKADGLRYIISPIGVFDCVVVTISVVDNWIIGPGGENQIKGMSSMRAFRLFRLARIVRLLTVSKELSLLIAGLFSSISAVVWAFLLLLVFMYLGALFCALLIGNTENEDVRSFFGSVPLCLLTHFKLVTLEGWPDISDATMEESPAWAVYFIVFILVTNMSLMNLVTGVICEKVMEKKKDKWSREEMESEMKKFRQVLRQIFDAYDIDRSGYLSYEEYVHMITLKPVQRVLGEFSISLDVPVNQLFELLDLNGDGALTFEEFCSSLMRLRGTKQSMATMMLQYDIVEGLKVIRKTIAKTKEDMIEQQVQTLEEIQGHTSKEFAHIHNYIDELGSMQPQKPIADDSVEVVAQRLQDLISGWEMITTNLNEPIQAVLPMPVDDRDHLESSIDFPSEEITETAEGAAQTDEVWEPKGEDTEKKSEVLLDNSDSTGCSGDKGDLDEPEDEQGLQGIQSPEEQPVTKSTIQSLEEQPHRRASMRSVLSFIDRERKCSESDGDQSPSQSWNPMNRKSMPAVPSDGGAEALRRIARDSRWPQKDDEGDQSETMDTLRRLRRIVKIHNTTTQE